MSLVQPSLVKYTQGVGKFSLTEFPSVINPSLDQEKHRFLEVANFQLRSGQEISLSLKHSVYYQGSLEEAWKKPIRVVHPALTGTSKMFTDRGTLGVPDLGDGWGRHLKGAEAYNLENTTVLVVEPLAGNGRSGDYNFPCSADEMFLKHGINHCHPVDTVKLISQILEAKGVSEVTLDCYSMGGIFIPTWLEQTDIKVNQVNSVYSGFHIPNYALDYWQIQLDLLPERNLLGTSKQKPNFNDIAERLIENFGGVSALSEDTPFNIVTKSIAKEIKDLEQVFEKESAYYTAAMKVGRKVSFLRFQTKDYNNELNIKNSNSKVSETEARVNKIQKYLQNRADDFVNPVSGVGVEAYRSLVSNFYVSQKFTSVCHQTPEVNALFNPRDLLYLKHDGSHGDLSVTNFDSPSFPHGHDAFLMEGLAEYFTGWLDQVSMSSNVT